MIWERFGVFWWEYHVEPRCLGGYLGQLFWFKMRFGLVQNGIWGSYSGSKWDKAMRKTMYGIR